MRRESAIKGQRSDDGDGGAVPVSPMLGSVMACIALGASSPQSVDTGNVRPVRPFSMARNSRKRAVPVTAAPRTRDPSTSAAEGRAVIRAFHTALKRAAQEDKGKAREVPREALAAYQRMSALGQRAERGGGAERVLVGVLGDS